MSLLITDALAAGEAAPQGNPMGSFLMLGGFIAIFYLLMWRPQHKRAKAHRDLITGLAKGDEVVTNGGLLGKIVNIQEDFITLAISAQTEIQIQKPAITAALPKGTVKLS